MESYKILFNRSYSADTDVVFSDVGLFNGYYSNKTNGLGGGVTNRFNIHNYIEGSKNQNIVKEFLIFLTGNTSHEEFIEIYYNNEKLSNIFNNFYNNTILKGAAVNPSIIHSSISGMTSVSFFDNIFNWDGDSPEKYLSGITLSINKSTKPLVQKNRLVDYNDGQNYYIPIFLKRKTMVASDRVGSFCKSSNNKIFFSPPMAVGIVSSPLLIIQNGLYSTMSFLSGESDVPSSINQSNLLITGVVHTILQCFVDLNLSIDSREFWNNDVPLINTSTFQGVHGGFNFIPRGSLKIFSSSITGVSSF